MFVFLVVCHLVHLFTMLSIWLQQVLFISTQKAIFSGRSNNVLLFFLLIFNFLFFLQFLHFQNLISPIFGNKKTKNSGIYQVQVSFQGPLVVLSTIATAGQWWGGSFESKNYKQEKQNYSCRFSSFYQYPKHIISA